MAARHRLALIIAIGLPVPGQALPIVELGVGDTAIESRWIWEGPGIRDLEGNGGELSILFPTLSVADHDDFVAGLLGSGIAGEAGLANAGTWSWREASEADPVF